MQKTEHALELTDYRGRTSPSAWDARSARPVCTVNDVSSGTNPQEMLQRLFMGKDVAADEPLVRFCTGCYRCTGACPWEIRIPDVVRALRHVHATESPFEKPSRGRSPSSAGSTSPTFS
jgi:Fe-S oxidoreductase